MTNALQVEGLASGYGTSEVISDVSPDFSRHLIECCGKLTSAIPQPSAVIWA